MSIDSSQVPGIRQLATMQEIARAAGGVYAAGAFSPTPRGQGDRGFFVHPEAHVHHSTIIFPGAYIGPHVTIGSDCVIGPNAAIGQPGFGYTEQPDGSWAYREHLGGVVIEDDVHIGANACIDQGRHRETRIGRGSRVDNQCHVSHNVHIGEDCLIIAHAMIAGSCSIGNGAIIAPGAMIRDHVEVGARAFVGLGAVVVSDIPDAEVWAGNPAVYLRPRGEELR
jgi:UDP-3-O-[3-hydroxymyristoyl] glucosamine N-acyltransferase